MTGAKNSSCADELRVHSEKVAASDKESAAIFFDNSIIDLQLVMTEVRRVAAVDRIIFYYACHDVARWGESDFLF